MNVTVIYNAPEEPRYDALGESGAVLGVLEEVDAVVEALGAREHITTCIALRPPLERTRKMLNNIGADLVFNLFEGFAGTPETEAAIAGFLEEIGIPFTGCPALALALALDKPRMKELMRGSGIETPEYQVLSPANMRDFHLGFPCIVKPFGEDASHGITEDSLVNSLDSLVEQVDRVSGRYGGRAMVEEFVGGREFNATVLGTEVLPVSEIVYTLPASRPKLLTYGAKWEPEDIYFHNTNPVCPAEINKKIREEIESTARSAFGLLGGRGYARVDMRYNSADRLCVLEVNPNPDISPTAGAAKQAAAAGMGYPDFIDRICRLALER